MRHFHPSAAFTLAACITLTCVLRPAEEHHDPVDQDGRAQQPFPTTPVHLVNSKSLAWEELPELPDAFGFGGPLVGTHNGALIVAGGANFPNGPPWPADGKPAGAKVWHDRIFVLIPGDTKWREAGRLPRPLAYAAVVSHATGMYVLGGESFDESRKNHDVAAVLRLTWDARNKRVRVEDDALPPLPRASSYHGGAIIGDTIFVAASHPLSKQSRRLATKALWSLNLAHAREFRRWKAQPRLARRPAIQNGGGRRERSLPGRRPARTTLPV